MFALGGEAEEAAPTTTTTTTTTAPTTTTTIPVPVAPLTGLPGDYGDRIEPPRAVREDRQRSDRPGPTAASTQADIVYEERVEGNITRLAAVFHSTDAAEIGPVRSTRSTDSGLVGLFGRPLYASSGANATVLNILHKSSAVDIGHNMSGGGFVRQPGRPAPHNLFTTLAALYAKAPERTPPPKPVFVYRSEGEAPPASVARPASEVVAQLRWCADLAVRVGRPLRSVAPLPRC